jgi:hypothetical protein
MLVPQRGGAGSCVISCVDATTMADFNSSLASQAGIDSGLAEKGVGALLPTLQKHTAGNIYSDVAAVIPNAGNLLSIFNKVAGGSQAMEPAGGLAGMLGGMLGGGKSDALSMLIGQFSKSRFFERYCESISSGVVSVPPE